MAASRVCCRPRVRRRPPVSRVKRSSRRSRIWAGDGAVVAPRRARWRAADRRAGCRGLRSWCRRLARSPRRRPWPARGTAGPRGSPPIGGRRRATAPGRRARHRGPTPRGWSPGTRRFGHRLRRSSIRSAAASSTCSQLSTTMSTDFPSILLRSCSGIGTPLSGTKSMPSANASGTASSSPTLARSTKNTPSGKASLSPRPHLDRQSGLAAPARPRQRDQPACPQALADLPHVLFTADQARTLGREPAGSPGQGPDRRELGGHSVSHDLVQPLRAVDVPQGVLTEVDRRRGPVEQPVRRRP